MSKAGVIVAAMSLLTLIGSALIEQIGLCLCSGVLLGVGITMAIIGDDI